MGGCWKQILCGIYCRWSYVCWSLLLVQQAANSALLFLLLALSSQSDPPTLICLRDDLKVRFNFDSLELLCQESLFGESSSTVIDLSRWGSWLVVTPLAVAVSSVFPYFPSRTSLSTSPHCVPSPGLQPCGSRSGVLKINGRVGETAHVAWRWQATSCLKLMPRRGRRTIAAFRNLENAAHCDVGH